MFTNVEIARIKRKVRKLDKCWFMTVEREPSGIWMYADFSETELRLEILPECRLIISRVHFEHKRCGNMTALFSLLREIALAHKSLEIVVQGASTYEMVSWCVKNGFRSVRPSIMMPHGFGDYVFKIHSGNYKLFNGKVRNCAT